MEDLSIMRRLHYNAACTGFAERFVDGEDIVEGGAGGGLLGGGDAGKEETETVAVFDCHCCACRSVGV